MLKEDLESKLGSMRSGASLDYSTRSHDNSGNEEIKIYDIISHFLKLTQAHTTDELVKIITQTTTHISYCSDCQRGTENIKMQGEDPEHKAWCPKCFKDYQRRLKEAGVI